MSSYYQSHFGHNVAEVDGLGFISDTLVHGSHGDYGFTLSNHELPLDEFDLYLFNAPPYNDIRNPVLPLPYPPSGVMLYNPPSPIPNEVDIATVLHDDVYADDEGTSTGDAGRHWSELSHCPLGGQSVPLGLAMLGDFSQAVGVNPTLIWDPDAVLGVENDDLSDYSSPHSISALESSPSSQQQSSIASLPELFIMSEQDSHQVSDVSDHAPCINASKDPHPISHQETSSQPMDQEKETSQLASNHINPVSDSVSNKEASAFETSIGTTAAPRYFHVQTPSAQLRPGSKEVQVVDILDEFLLEFFFEEYGIRACFCSTPPPVDAKSHSKRTEPDHIPRPPNSFITFRSWLNYFIPKMKPLDKGQNRVRVCGYVWRSLRDDLQEPWVDESAALKQQHAIDHPDYKYRPKKPATDGRKAKKGKKRDADELDQSEKPSSLVTVASSVRPRRKKKSQHVTPGETVALNSLVPMPPSMQFNSDNATPRTRRSRSRQGKVKPDPRLEQSTLARVQHSAPVGRHIDVPPNLAQVPPQAAHFYGQHAYIQPQASMASWKGAIQMTPATSAYSGATSSTYHAAFNPSGTGMHGIAPQFGLPAVVSHRGSRRPQGQGMFEKEVPISRAAAHRGA